MFLLEQINDTTFIIETDDGLSTLTLDEDGDWQLMMPTTVAGPIDYTTTLIGHGKNGIDDTITIDWLEAIKRSLKLLGK